MKHNRNNSGDVVVGTNGLAFNFGVLNTVLDAFTEGMKSVSPVRHRHPPVARQQVTQPPKPAVRSPFVAAAVPSRSRSYSRSKSSENELQTNVFQPKSSIASTSNQSTTKLQRNVQTPSVPPSRRSASSQSKPLSVPASKDFRSLREHDFGAVLVQKVCSSSGTGAPTIVPREGVEKDVSLPHALWTTNTAREACASAVLQINYRSLRSSTSEDIENNIKREVLSDVRLCFATDQSPPTTQRCDVFASMHPNSGFLPILRNEVIFDAKKAKPVMKGECLLDEILIPGNMLAPYVKVQFKGSGAVVDGTGSIRFVLLTAIKAASCSTKETQLRKVEQELDNSLDAIIFHGVEPKGLEEKTSLPLSIGENEQPHPQSVPAPSEQVPRVNHPVPVPKPSMNSKFPEDASKTVVSATYYRKSTSMSHSPQATDSRRTSAGLTVSSPRPSSPPSVARSHSQSTVNEEASTLSDLFASSEPVERERLHDMVRKANAEDIRELAAILRRTHQQQLLETSLDGEQETEKMGKEEEPPFKNQEREDESAKVPFKNDSMNGRDSAIVVADEQQILPIPAEGVLPRPEETQAVAIMSRQPPEPMETTRPTKRVLVNSPLRPATFENALRTVVTKALDQVATPQQYQDPWCTVSYSNQYPIHPSAAHTIQVGTNKVMARPRHLLPPPSEPVSHNASTISNVSLISSSHRSDVTAKTVMRGLQKAKESVQVRQRVGSEVLMLPVLSMEEICSRLLQSKRHPSMTARSGSSLSVIGGSNMSFTAMHGSCLFQPQCMVNELENLMMMPYSVIITTDAGFSEDYNEKKFVDKESTMGEAASVVFQVFKERVAVKARGLNCIAFEIISGASSMNGCNSPSMAFPSSRSLLVFCSSSSRDALTSFFENSSNAFQLSCWTDMHCVQFERFIDQVAKAAGVFLPTSSSTPFLSNESSSPVYHGNELLYYSDVVEGHPLAPFLPGGQGMSMTIRPFCWRKYYIRGKISVFPNTEASTSKKSVGKIHHDDVNVDEKATQSISKVLRLSVGKLEPKYLVWDKHPTGLRIVLVRDDLMRCASRVDSYILTSSASQGLGSYLLCQQESRLMHHIHQLKPSEDLAESTMDLLRLCTQNHYTTVASDLLNTSAQSLSTAGTAKQNNNSGGKEISQLQKDDFLMDTLYCWHFPYPKVILLHYAQPDRFEPEFLSFFTAATSLEQALNEA